MGTVLDMVREQIARNGDRPALRTRASGQWVARSFREWEESAQALAQGLAELGVVPGDRVALLANTRREWAEADLGILLAGAVSVPLYPQTSPEGIAHILEDSGAVVVLAEDPLHVERLFDPRLGTALRPIRRVVCFDTRRRLERPDARGRLEVRLEDVVASGESSRVTSWAALLDAGRRVLERGRDSLPDRAGVVTPDTPATIVYTSGTTGPPRGVVLTHGNLVFELDALVERLELGPSDEQLLFLPLAHIFARLLLLGALRGGYCTAFADSPARALDQMAEVHPTFFGAVPRVYEKIHARAQRSLREESSLRRRAATWAFEVGARVATARREGREPSAALAAQHRVASAAVLEKVRRLFGRRLRFAISGAAPLARELAEWFHACDVLVLEGYGLTETTAATHLNLPRAFRFGTVGRALPGVECRIAADGEVLVRGPNVMAGYFRRADETAAVLDHEGWFHTGDVGILDAQGYLHVTDRKRDLIVTAAGRNVAPQDLEAALRRSPWISQAVVLGDRRPYLVALVTLDEEVARAWAREGGLDLAWPELLRHPAVRRHVDDAVEALNARTEPWQRIRRVAVLARDLSAETGELTPTLKLRRREIEHRFGTEIDALYDR